MSFDSKKLKEKLEENFGFDHFKSKQEDIIRSVLEGKDTFVIMPTGGGKSLCYQLPALMSDGTTLVISPLIALMKNQVDSLRGYNQQDGIAHFLNSSLTKAQIKCVRSDVISGKTKILYIAPETLTKEENLDFFRSVEISFVAVDEAHCISEWGHDFRPEYRRIRQMIDAISTDFQIPIMALTATATTKVRSDIVKILDMNEHNSFITTFNRTNLYYEVRQKQDKTSTVREIIKFINSLSSKSGIIYVRNRKTTSELADILKMNKLNAAPYHAGLDASTRAKTQDDFLHERVDIIVATIAFGMGIDKPDVRFVIHYDMPKSIENYYQETGRAGRDGILSHCMAFYSPKDLQNLEKFLRDKNVAERELGLMLLKEVMDYAETGGCRRSFLLNYFGEHYSEAQCTDLCDNCKNPPIKRHVTDEMVEMLELINKLGDNCDANLLLHYITGKSSNKTQTYGYEKQDSFGFGKDEDPVFWESMIRQSELKGLVSKSIERYGVLSITKEGLDFIKEKPDLSIPINRKFEAIDSSPAQPSSGALDPGLLKILKATRERIAKKANLPKYVIFQDVSLDEMATNYPISMDDLLSISGVNAGKAKKYGKPFLEEIKEYVELNDIVRPEDFVVKTVANKSKIKVGIIHSIDKKMPLQDIADTNNMNYEDLLEELYMIVHSGTKIDIDYHLEEELDEDSIEEITDYFLSSETDDVDTAMEELEDDDYTAEEIKLVRLKFLSEYAN